MRHRKRKPWAWLLLLVLLLVGCWDRREIEERSNSLAAGVDLCRANEGCTIAVTRQIAIPGRIPQGVAEGGGGGDVETVTVIRSPGRDILASVRHAQSVLHRKLGFGHTRIFIWSEDRARQSLAEDIDVLRRQPETRRLMWIAIAEGSAEDVMRARPPLERIPGLYLNNMFDDAVKTGRLPSVFFGDFLVRLSNKGEEAVAPLIRMVGPDRPQLAGVAVFRGEQMVGKLTPEETATYMQVRGLHRAAILMRVDLPGGGLADLRIYGQKTSYKVSGGPKRIYAHVEIEMESELMQLSPELNSSDPRVLDLIQRQATEEVTRRANALVEKLQTEYKSDILSLGERVRAYLPTVWKSIDDWPAAFADARFTFGVKIYVRRTGMGTD